jgi:hypothetical protein
MVAMRQPQARFVVLHHVPETRPASCGLRPAALETQAASLEPQAAQEHWDLMLERGDLLATWQLARHPRYANEPIAARRIGDHRKAYLEYEGPIARNRGHVTRVDAGSYQLLEVSDRGWTIECSGQFLRGRYTLSPLEANQTGEFRHVDTQADSGGPGS